MGGTRKILTMTVRLLTILAAVLALPGRLPAMTLEELAQQPELWPAQVTVTSATKATVIRNGQPAGMMLLGAGRPLIVAGVAADGITGRMGDATVRVAADKMDIFFQVGKAHPEHATEKQQAAKRASAPLQAELRRLAGPAPAAAPTPPPVAAPTPPAWAGEITPIQRRLAGRLVRLDNGALPPLDSTIFCSSSVVLKIPLASMAVRSMT